MNLWPMVLAGRFETATAQAEAARLMALGYGVRLVDARNGTLELHRTYSPAALAAWLDGARGSR